MKLAKQMRHLILRKYFKRIREMNEITRINKGFKIRTLTDQRVSTLVKTALVVGGACLLPEICFAAGEDAFAGILTKANGWVGGSAGKLITFSSLAIAGIMGVAGFPAKHVAGAVGVGLLLSSANSIVNMIF